MVSKLDSYDIFIMENNPEHAELQAMALAAEALRGPLSDIMATTERLFPRSELNQDETASNQISKINRGLHQMLRMISNMSDSFRYSEEFVHKLEICNPCRIIEEILEKCSMLLTGSEITLTYDLPKEQLYCPLDREKVERALYNMLSNAIKYTPKGGTVNVQLTRKQNMLYLTVEDTGSGIAKQLQNSFHNRYQRAPTLEDSRHGIGLGMVLIQCAAAVHQGTVLVQQPGQGTRITMTLKILPSGSAMVRSDIMHIDYAGERDHWLIELSDTLPISAYKPNGNR
jgi:K+-sensing histidine kinase KdpD